MNKLKSIMIDMDDVIVKGGFLYLINEYLNTNYVEEDFKDFYMQDVIPDKAEFFKFFLTRNLYDHSMIVENAYEVMKELNEQYKVYIGTSYVFPEIINESGVVLVNKYNYLMKMFPFFSPSNFVFLVDKSVLNCDIKIDDRVDNLVGAENKILFSAYHNKNISDEELNGMNITRADSWLDIKNMLII